MSSSKYWDGSKWVKLQDSIGVKSVAGKTGVVTLEESDITDALGYDPVDENDTVYTKGYLEGVYVGKRRLKPDGSLYTSGSNAWKCYKFNVTNLTENDAVIINTVEPQNDYVIPMASFITCDYDSFTNSTETVGTVVGTPIVYPKCAEAEGRKIKEFHFIPKDAKTLLVSIDVNQSIDTALRVEALHYGSFSEAYSTISNRISNVEQLKPSATPTATGKVLKVSAVNDDGSFTSEWADDVAGQSTNVKINGTSITSNGVANIPLSSSSTSGVVKASSSYGVQMSGENLTTVKASESDINAGTDDYKPIVSSNVSYAVKSAMTSTEGTTWTESEQSAIRNKIGAASATATTPVVSDTQPTNGAEWWINTSEEESSLSQINEDIAELGQLKPETAPSAVGKILKVLSVNDDGTFTCEWADAPTGSSTDVQINGTSITSEGVANIPLMANGTIGVTKLSTTDSSGLEVVSGVLKTIHATDAQIANRNNSRRHISPQNLVKAVDSVLTSTTASEALTTAEQANARKRIGASGLCSTKQEVDITEDATSAEINFDYEVDSVTIIMRMITKSNLTAQGRIFVQAKINGSWVYISRDGGAWLDYTKPMSVIHEMTIKKGYAFTSRWYYSNTAAEHPQYVTAKYENTGVEVSGLIQAVRFTCYNNYKFMNGDKIIALY